MINSTMGEIKTIVSIVAPFYNEQATVDEFFRRVYSLFEQENSKYIVEVVAVNDGSNDETLSSLIEMTNKYPRVCVVDLSRNFGKEVALSAGLENVRVQVVVTIDSDLQHPPEKITEMIQLWEEGFEVVLAKRMNRDTDHVIKRITSNAFYKIHNAISDINIPSDVGDFRLMDISVVNEINKLKESRRFMKGLFAWVGFRTITIQYNAAQRVSGRSNFSTWKSWNFALDGITSSSIVPLKIWTYVGISISFFSFAYAIYLVSKMLIFGSVTPGFTSLMVGVLFIGGIQLIGIGMLGEYLGRIYIEVKNRPVYIARKIHRSNN